MVEGLEGMEWIEQHGCYEEVLVGGSPTLFQRLEDHILDCKVLVVVQHVEMLKESAEGDEDVVHSAEAGLRDVGRDL